MSTENRKLRAAIQQLAGTFNKDLVDILACTVVSVDGFTCDCTPISGDGGSMIPGVKLNAEKNDGFLIVPAVGSTVLVAHSTRNNYYVFMYSDIDKVICVIDNNNSYEFSSSGFVWNGGLLGGMAKTPVLKTKYNALEVIMNQLIGSINAIKAASISSPAVPVTNATLSAFFTAVTAALITLTTQTEIEDTKIKH